MSGQVKPCPYAVPASMVWQVFTNSGFSVCQGVCDVIGE